jgi:hypothetical protein
MRSAIAVLASGGLGQVAFAMDRSAQLQQQEIQVNKPTVNKQMIFSDDNNDSKGPTSIIQCAERINRALAAFDFAIEDPKVVNTSSVNVNQVIVNQGEELKNGDKNPPKGKNAVMPKRLPLTKAEMEAKLLVVLQRTLISKKTVDALEGVRKAEELNPGPELEAFVQNTYMASVKSIWTFFFGTSTVEKPNVWTMIISYFKGMSKEDAARFKVAKEEIQSLLKAYNEADETNIQSAEEMATTKDDLLDRVATLVSQYPEIKGKLFDFAVKSNVSMALAVQKKKLQQSSKSNEVMKYTGNTATLVVVKAANQEKKTQLNGMQEELQLREDIRKLQAETEAADE